MQLLDPVQKRLQKLLEQDIRMLLIPQEIRLDIPHIREPTLVLRMQGHQIILMIQKVAPCQNCWVQTVDLIDFDHEL